MSPIEAYREADVIAAELVADMADAHGAHLPMTTLARAYLALRSESAPQDWKRWHDQLGAMIDQVGHPDYSLKVNSTAAPMPQCPYCGSVPHQHIGQCPAVKKIEYYPDGTIKSVEKKESGNG